MEPTGLYIRRQEEWKQKRRNVTCFKASWLEGVSYTSRIEPLLESVSETREYTELTEETEANPINQAQNKDESKPDATQRLPASLLNGRGA